MRDFFDLKGGLIIALALLLLAVWLSIPSQPNDVDVNCFMTLDDVRENFKADMNNSDVKKTVDSLLTVEFVTKENLLEIWEGLATERKHLEDVETLKQNLTNCDELSPDPMVFEETPTTTERIYNQVFSAETMTPERDFDNFKSSFESIRHNQRVKFVKAVEEAIFGRSGADWVKYAKAVYNISQDQYKASMWTAYFNVMSPYLAYNDIHSSWAESEDGKSKHKVEIFKNTSLDSMMTANEGNSDEFSVRVLRHEKLFRLIAEYAKIFSNDDMVVDWQERMNSYVIEDLPPIGAVEAAAGKKIPTKKATKKSGFSY